ncbi:uncharacterized protein LOC131163413 [Malania oleifera]|uniref:uncharacterized protein LOC131163413 n=1 Tax=Malania oleifera TaxID=397392 RepID=UPI0025ADF955|nr:uncharacterized protein LOC131163413 [Malania oleifera]
MPFGLKNVEATYQRLVNRIFKDQLGKTMEAYVDNMLVKIMEAGKHCKDLRETFELLRRYQMKLNSSKCVFGVSAGKFLGFMVTHRGIEANPDKRRALLEMEAPRTKKEIQVLTGMIASLSRAENRKADALAKLASETGSKWKDAIYLQRIGKPFYEEESINSVESEISEEDWRAPLFLYLRDGSLPEDNKESLKVRKKTARYTLIGRELYRRSLTLSYLRCLNNEEGKYVLREIHEGVRGNHLTNRALAHKAMRQGFYWPIMKKDALELVKRCGRCQRCAAVPHVPYNLLSPLTSPCPFAQWGMDILGPLPLTASQRKFLVVAIDYFTKWVEVEPLATITEQNITHFVENMNRTILHGLRIRLKSMQGRWTKELPLVIWAYHTTKRAATGESPFMLVFGAEAVIPAEVGIPSWKRQYFNEQANNEELRSEIDLLEERQDHASLKVAAYQQRVAKYYNNGVKVRNFPGDLVLRKTRKSPIESGSHKLKPNWGVHTKSQPR